MLSKSSPEKVTDPEKDDGKHQAEAIKLVETITLKNVGSNLSMMRALTLETPKSIDIQLSSFPYFAQYRYL
jgi:hypothetical protein